MTGQEVEATASKEGSPPSSSRWWWRWPWRPLDSRPSWWHLSLSVAALGAAAGGRADRMTYPLFAACRLALGTLYPAYASYKAVRTKNVREYVGAA